MEEYFLSGYSCQDLFFDNSWITCRLTLSICVETWLRGKRCQEDINNFWMGHKPQTMSELYSRMDEELEQRLHEAEIVGVGFDVPACCSKCSKVSPMRELDAAA